MIFDTAESRRTYLKRHQHVRNSRGSARNYLCAGCCGKKAQDWATLHGKSGDELNDYVALCRSCHVQYDFPNGRVISLTARNKIGSFHRGKTLSKNTREKLRVIARGRRHDAATRILMSEKALIREKQHENANAKLSFDDVRAIRSSNADAHQLAEMYGVKVQQIKRILNKTAWKNVN